MANLNKIRKKRARAKSLDEIQFGGEPTVEKIEGSNDPQLTNLLNWYNYMYDAKKGKVWLVEWMKANDYPKKDISTVKSAPDWAASTTACWVARMANRGAIIAQENVDFIDSRIKQLIEKYEAIKEEKEDAPPKVNIQARIAFKNQGIMDEAEAIVDNYVNDNHEEMYDYLVRSEATPVVANKMLDYYRPILEELTSGDAEVKEAHSAKELKFWQNAYASIVSDLERFVNNKKVRKVRKARTPKAKPISKIVEKVKYQKQDNELKLVSANPESIVGATQLWLYNTKYQTLAVYNADPLKTLSVKGTTLINYDEKTAMTKKLRKPDESIQLLLKAGKVELRKFMDKLTTKPGNANGRINDNTIILRVIT